MRGVFCGWWTVNALSELRWLESDTSGRVWGLFCAWISVDLQEETVVSLGNALPTETPTAAVDSCPVLQARTNERGEREWEKGSFITQKMGSVQMSAEIPLQWIRQKYSTAIQMVLFTPQGKKSLIFRVIKRQAFVSYLRSVDFEGNIVALRRPLGGFGHFETGTNQVNTELALTGDSRHEFIHERRLIHLCTKGKFNMCVSPTCGHLAAL